MAAYRNRSTPALSYDCSMLRGDETIFLFPSRHRSSSSAAAPPPWYDDETIFLVPSDQSRRFASANGRDRNQGFFQNRDASERRRMVAENIRSKVVRDHRDGDDGICVVCQDNLVAQNRKIVRLDCGHYYHQRCITNWLNVKNSCPLCQTSVLE